MSYQTNLLKRMETADWPSFDRADFLAELDIMAGIMFERHTTEGYLASLLIYQQLIEEMLKLLVKYSNVVVQCSVFPQEINFPERRNGLMLGQVISQLESGLMDDNIKNLIKVSRSFAELRNRLVHRITAKTDEMDIKRQARQGKKYHDQIFTLFEAILDNYRLTLKEYNKNYEEYKELIEEPTKEGEKPKKKAKAKKKSK
jgi:hypothetical protein